jgi:hypothetical protein
MTDTPKTAAQQKTRSGSGLSTRLGNASTPPPAQPVDTEEFANTLTLDQLRKLADEQLRKENHG